MVEPSSIPLAARNVTPSEPLVGDLGGFCVASPDVAGWSCDDSRAATVLGASGKEDAARLAKVDAVSAGRAVLGTGSTSRSENPRNVDGPAAGELCAAATVAAVIVKVTNHKRAFEAGSFICWGPFLVAIEFLNSRSCVWAWFQFIRFHVDRYALLDHLDGEHDTEASVYPDDNAFEAR